MNTLLETEKEKFRLEIPKIEEEYNIKILLAYVRGSQMYGTATEESDVDISFVYQQPTDEILRGNIREDIDYDGKSNIVGYEILKYIRMLGLNNPNILESLDIPDECLIHQDESMVNVFKQEDWLSKLSEKSILGYADSQIKKATGLNKNMNKEVVKKTILDYCFIPYKENLIPFYDWYESYEEFNRDKLNSFSLDYNNWALTKIDRDKGFYNLITSLPGDNFRGLIKDDSSTQLRLSEVPKDLGSREKFILHYNLDGFEAHCREYKSYQKWLTERNEERHNTNVAHGKNYDSKNMMHMFRILEIAENVAIHKRIIVRSENVEKLRVVRSGEEKYDELMLRAEGIFDRIKSLFSQSDLRKTPDIEKGKEILLSFRKNWVVTSVDKVCEDCGSNDIIDVNCVCITNPHYLLVEREVDHCGCCGREI